MNKKFGVIRILFLIFAATVIFRCSEKSPEERLRERIQSLEKMPASKTFSTLLNLEQYVLSKFQSGEIDELAKTLADYDLYKELYPYTIRGRSKNALSAREFFDTSIKSKRMNALMFQFNIYREKNYRLVSIGNPQKIEKLGPFKLYKFIPLVLQTKDKNNQSIKDVNDKIFGEILEKEGKYYWLNIFQ